MSTTTSSSLDRLIVFVAPSVFLHHQSERGEEQGEATTTSVDNGSLDLEAKVHRPSLHHLQQLVQELQKTMGGSTTDGEIGKEKLKEEEASPVHVQIVVPGDTSLAVLEALNVQLSEKKLPCIDISTKPTKGYQRMRKAIKEAEKGASLIKEGTPENDDPPPRSTSPVDSTATSTTSLMSAGKTQYRSFLPLFPKVPTDAVPYLHGNPKVQQEIVHRVDCIQEWLEGDEKFHQQIFKNLFSATQKQKRIGIVGASSPSSTGNSPVEMSGAEDNNTKKAGSRSITPSSEVANVSEGGGNNKGAGFSGEALWMVLDTLNLEIDDRMKGHCIHCTAPAHDLENNEEENIDERTKKEEKGGIPASAVSAASQLLRKMKTHAVVGAHQEMTSSFDHGGKLVSDPKGILPLHQRLQGVVKRYNPHRGFGFITAKYRILSPPKDQQHDDHKEVAEESLLEPLPEKVDLFVHQSYIQMRGYRGLNIGATVVFEVGMENGRRQAIDVLQPQGVFRQSLTELAKYTGMVLPGQLEGGLQYGNQTRYYYRGFPVVPPYQHFQVHAGEKEKENGGKPLSASNSEVKVSGGNKVQQGEDRKEAKGSNVAGERFVRAGMPPRQNMMPFFATEHGGWRMPNGTVVYPPAESHVTPPPPYPQHQPSSKQ